LSFKLGEPWERTETEEAEEKDGGSGESAPGDKGGDDESPPSEAEDEESSSTRMGAIFMDIAVVVMTACVVDLKTGYAL